MSLEDIKNNEEKPKDLVDKIKEGFVFDRNLLFMNVDEGLHVYRNEDKGKELLYYRKAGGILFEKEGEITATEIVKAYGKYEREHNV